MCLQKFRRCSRQWGAQRFLSRTWGLKCRLGWFGSQAIGRQPSLIDEPKLSRTRLQLEESHTPDAASCRFRNIMKEKRNSRNSSETTGGWIFDAKSVAYTGWAKLAQEVGSRWPILGRRFGQPGPKWAKLKGAQNG